MSNFSFSKWFNNFSIAHKLYSVIGIMAILIAVELGTLFFAVHTLSSVRAFVGAEGLWSKSQKDAVYQLQHYSQTHHEEDIKSFYQFMKVPAGHHKTLVELLNKNPDLAVARQGLLEGGNHPEDIDGMIKLFRRFKDISYIHESFNIWAEADATISELIPIAEKLQAEINSPTPSQLTLNEISNEIEPINQKLTTLEDDFSSTLGEGARWLEKSILSLLLAMALTVWLTGLTLTYFVVKGITKGLKEIKIASQCIAQRDFTARAGVFSNDEIGVLANSFNNMAAELSSSVQKQLQSSQDLEAKTNFIQENEKRIVSIMDALVKTTQLNFSEKLIISDRRDELDAIALGFNTMSEELEFHLQQLKQNEELLNDAQRLAKIGNWEINLVTNEVQWSDEMFNVYGYGDERFKVSLDKALERMLPEDAERSKARMKINIEKAIQSFKENNTVEFQNDPITYSLIMPDGSRKVVQGIGKIKLNSKGQVTKMAGTVQDITKQHKAELKLNQYTIELELKNKELAQFAFAASHDLQEPLRTISNFSKLLAIKIAAYHDEDMNKYMSLITGGTNRMSNRIFDLLNYSRIGKDMRKSITDCNLLVKDVLLDLSALIEQTSAKINVEKLPVIICGDLNIVFQNLIVNAIKFKREGVPPIINISATDKENEFIFKFEDNGIGIEEDYYDRIFIIFQRLHKRTEYEGTGIGLSLCKKIIELHGGNLWVESEFGKGSTFYFTIPKNLKETDYEN